jgi:hypothetical protein
LFVFVYSPDSSWSTNVTGLPRRELADAVTTAISPSFGSRMKSSRISIRSASGPPRIMALSGR